MYRVLCCAVVLCCVLFSGQALEMKFGSVSANVTLAGTGLSLTFTNDASATATLTSVGPVFDAVRGGDALMTVCMIIISLYNVCLNGL